jgi:hypothetical protein
MLSNLIMHLNKEEQRLALLFSAYFNIFYASMVRVSSKGTVALKRT